MADMVRQQVELRKEMKNIRSGGQSPGNAREVAQATRSASAMPSGKPRKTPRRLTPAAPPVAVKAVAARAVRVARVEKAAKAAKGAPIGGFPGGCWTTPRRSARRTSRGSATTMPFVHGSMAVTGRACASSSTPPASARASARTPRARCARADGRLDRSEAHEGPPGRRVGLLQSRR